jgi:hypothetical protein
VDPEGHERGSVSLRCTRQQPLEVRTTVTMERLRRRDGGSRGHVSNDGTPKACITTRWNGWCDRSRDARTRGSTPERVRLRCHPRWAWQWRTSLGASDDNILPRHKVVVHPRCEVAVSQGGGPIFMLFCIYIYANVNRFLRPIFQFVAPLPSICLFMIFLLTFYVNDLLILCIISFT